MGHHNCRGDGCPRCERAIDAREDARMPDALDRAEEERLIRRDEARYEALFYGTGL